MYSVGWVCSDVSAEHVAPIFAINMNLNPAILKMEAASFAETLEETSCTV
jgi:hypothetical protein